MIILTLLLSVFSWGENCQFSESLDSFRLQCLNSQAQWQQVDIDQAQFSVQLPQKLNIDLLFTKRLNGDYFITQVKVDKGERLYSWLNDSDFFYLNRMAYFSNKIDFLNKELLLFKQSMNYVLSLPIYEQLEDLARSSQKSIKAGYSMICRSIGKRRSGRYTVDGKRKSKRVWVGKKSSECYGRCGSGCSGSSSQYTQECLNHDVCNRTTGENLGVCSDEFWAASDGYFGAPNCQ